MFLKSLGSPLYFCVIISPLFILAFDKSHQLSLSHSLDRLLDVGKLADLGLCGRRWTLRNAQNAHASVCQRAWMVKGVYAENYEGDWWQWKGLILGENWWWMVAANGQPPPPHPGSYLNVPNTPCVTTLEITRAVKLTLNPISQFRTLASLAISKNVFFYLKSRDVPGWNHRLLNQILTQTSCTEMFILSNPIWRRKKKLKS